MRPTMTFTELCDFVTNRMRMSHIYQPLLIRCLVDAGGSATIRQLAQDFAVNDESEIHRYEKTIRAKPLRVLTKHSVVNRSDDLVSLSAGRLTVKQRVEVRRLCEERIASFMKVLCAKCNQATSKKDATDFRADPRESDFDATCPFCDRSLQDGAVETLGTVFAVQDAYPATKGHLLIIPRRHTPDFFSMTEAERHDANTLLRVMRGRLQAEDRTIAGFNVGANCGEAAGQTIAHAHIHLIPRRRGDRKAKKRGVRGAIMQKMSD